MLFAYCVDDVPCGIGVFAPSQLIVHTTLFVCFAIFLSLFAFILCAWCSVWYWYFCTQSVDYVHVLSYCLFALLFIMCASNVPCGIGVPCVHPVS